MHYRFILLLSFVFLSIASAQAQQLTLSGLVFDNDEQIALPGANIQLFHLPDSAAQLTTTNERGAFQFSTLEKGNYLLAIRFVGYEQYTKEIMLEEDTSLGQIKLKTSEELLKEVEVRDKMPRAVQKGDTTEFNSQAYKAQPDASAEDLIRKMPGIVIDNGKVQAQGEDVKEVLVDGKPFFGNDPTAALKNLPAEVIDKIQVFDKQSDQAQFTGFDDGQSAKTINIITLADKSNGQFGKVYAGYGLDNRYALGGNVNVFNGGQRFSIIGQSNNINIQNFATDDLLGVVGSTGQGRRRGGGGGGPGGRGGGGRGSGGGGSGGDASDFLVGQQSGISQTNALGFNYSDNWGEQIVVSGSYFFNNSSNSADQSLSRETFLGADSSQYYDERSLSESNNYNHRFNLRMEYTIDDKNSIIYQPSLSWQHNIGNELTDGQTYLENGQPLNATLNDYRADLRGLNLSNSLLYRHRFEKKGRTISLRLSNQINQQDGENALLAANIFNSRGIMTVDSLDQQSTLDKYDNTYSANVNYTEPLGEKLSLMLNYDVSLKAGKSDKLTYNYEESSDAYSMIDSTLSNQFESQYLTQAAGTGLRYNQGKLSLMGRVNYQIANLSNEQFFPAEDQIDRNFKSVLPFAMLHYRMEGGKNLRVFYRTNTDAPNVSDLQNVVDNSNPLMLRQGNPGLQQAYQHNLFGRFASTNVDKATTFFALLGGSYTQQYVGQSTFTALQDTLLDGNLMLQQGAQLTRPVNFDNSWSLRSFISYGIPLSALKSNLNFNSSVNYSRSPGLVNEQLNYANNLGFGLGLVLSSNISQQIDFTLSSRSNYNVVNNSLRADLNNNYFNQQSGLKLHARTQKGLFVETDINHQFYVGLSEDFNQNYVLMNLSVGKKIFKNQLGELKLTVFDLLNQNTSINRTVSETYIEDTQTEVLQRFGMLTFTYNLRNFRLQKS